MNFELNVEQLAIQKMTREFVEKEVIPVAAHYDEIEEMPVELIRRMVRQGYATVSLPEKYGGAGMDQVTLCLVTEELGRGCAGIATSVGANTLAALPILLAGSEEQKEHYLSAIAGGKLASFCLTEPGAGSDVSAIATTALADGDDYVINGVKCFITNGGYADLYVVFALTNPKRGVRSLTPFVVERGTLGLSAGKKREENGDPGQQYQRGYFRRGQGPRREPSRQGRKRFSCGHGNL